MQEQGVKYLITDLPIELLAYIFEFLEPKEIGKLSKLCRPFYYTSQLDSIWKRKCFELPLNRFKIENDEWSFRLIYTKVLSKYGKLLGFWRKNIDHYGGLLHVTFDSATCNIVGTEWNAPIHPNIEDPIITIQSFCLTPDDGGSNVAVCINDINNPHTPQHYCQLNLGKCVDGKIVEFHTECKSPNLHERLHEHLMLEEITSMNNRILLLRKISTIIKYKRKFSYTRLEWPLSITGAIIQPGLFKGDYDCHGIELIMLTYEDEFSVQGIKVTGDPHVPAGIVTFSASLSDAFVLNLEQQQQLEAVEVVRPMIPPNQLPEQPFQLPQGIDARQHDYPKKCKARFSGFGQIASDNFTDSSRIPGHWIVFSEDCFGFIWFDLEDFSLYHRVQEKH